MCGICGQYNLVDSLIEPKANVSRMTRSIAHRGPDDEGYFGTSRVGLGFRRLSIIDIAGGHQPMSDTEEHVWAVFNGEIYNFIELKAELEGFGHRFRTRSDTEVIVHGYKQWGDGVLNRLNGMFGLAIWDARKRRLVVARDPYGIKSVYFKVESNRLLFGSEIRSILAGSQVAPEIDVAAVSQFLRYRYTPAPKTLIKGIQKLAAGTLLVCENGRWAVSRWYRFEPRPDLSIRSDQDAVQQLLQIYQRAVKRQLISDVPVGLLLSGGVDSGLLLALMNQNGENWNTYTAGYGTNFADDELGDAKRTAEFFSSKHSPVLLDRALFEESLGGIINQLEEPVATSSIVPMFFVAQRARADVKVALMGQGPDELFGGYRRHLAVQHGFRGRWLPQWLQSVVRSCAASLSESEEVQRSVASLGQPDRLRRYEQILSLAPAATINGLFKPGSLPLGSEVPVIDSWAEIDVLGRHVDELTGFQFLEIRSTLPDELLMYGDKLSMAHGLEVRVPFLDKEVVEFAERLPAKFKVRGLHQKWLHRQVCKLLLPKEVLQRKKRGFAMNVVDDWFKSALSSKMNHIIADSSSAIYEYLDPQQVRQLLKSHQTGRANHHKLLFSIIVFEVWLRCGPHKNVLSPQAV